MKKWIRLLVCLLGIIVIVSFYKVYVTSNETKPNINDTVTEKDGNSGEIDPFKVVIDAGHGGVDPGSIGASGSYEKDFTLSVSKKVASLLEQDSKIAVSMTREADEFLSSEARERPNFANDLGADVFVSIHANTFTDPTVSGTETYYYHSNSKTFANKIHQYLIEATGYNDRGVKKENYFVLKDTTMPAVLLEIGYLTNPQDEQQMLTDDFQLSVAKAIVKGIKAYLGI
ncbi:N-acetylmuramoyl-L-alanine amidase family protein [Ornithinibacillus contaminans]|uniref:N-acetylmuramoyl-L-alanine amidase family protein n=1 Tax=Ornithinibacillus contaminans TaxID=694055 RepID=UPI00064E01F4|nr:N-acetylmuramoyl-L-alanine amidase [Ornithinibacillus contaminans]